MQNLEAIRQDLMYLAGRLLHRSAQTEHERRAAEYLAERFRAYSDDVEMDDFAASENYPYLFASYFCEFLVVATFALWWPVFAFAYGLTTFVAFLAEFMGYRIFSRFLPVFESQNVAARWLGTRPRATLIVTAHYDSGGASPLTRPEVLPWLRPILIALVTCMVLVLATCVIDAWGGLFDIDYPLAETLRWMAVGVLAAGAAALFFVSTQGEDIRGANNNASGVAALLQLAERVSAHPIEHADVWLVALGSHEHWMAGMRHLLAAHAPPRDTTYLLNLEAVGAGTLHYLTAEGMLLPMRADKRLVKAAAAEAGATDAKPGVLRGVPSAAHVPLHRGYHAMSIMALDERGLPIHWNDIDDRVTEVEESIIARATDFAEAILRNLDTQFAESSDAAKPV